MKCQKLEHQITKHAVQVRCTLTNQWKWLNELPLAHQQSYWDICKQKRWLQKKNLVFLFSWKSPWGLPGSLKDQGYRQTSFSLLGDCPAAGQADSCCRSEALPSGATAPDAPRGYVSKELRRKNIRKPDHGSLNNICLSRNVTAPPHPSVTPKETQVLQMRPCGDTAYGSSSGDPGLRGGLSRPKKAFPYAWLCWRF